MVDEDDWDVKNERNGNAEKINKGMGKKGRPTAKNGRKKKNRKNINLGP